MVPLVQEEIKAKTDIKELMENPVKMEQLVPPETTVLVVDLDYLVRKD